MAHDSPLAAGATAAGAAAEDGAGAPELPRPPAIETLEIENFRGLRRVRLAGLGRVNLLTGPNNIGKSSVLEALRLYAAADVPAMMQEIVREREEEEQVAAGRDGSFAAGRALRLISPFFSGFPGLADPWLPIIIDAGSKAGRRPLTLDLRWFRLHQDAEDQQPAVVEVTAEQVSGSGGGAMPGLVAETTRGQRRYLLPEHWEPLMRWPRRDVGPSVTRCVHLGPYSGRTTSSLAAWWDEIALSSLEPHVVDALRIIEPRIAAVSMVAGHRGASERIAKVRVEGGAQPLPLRSFGDGVNRLFAMALSLVNAKGGLLLIDEFENGLHYSVQADAWRMIFQVAAELDIQVFATTHSWDAVEAFQLAAAESPAQGALIRLARRGEDIIATTFDEDDLAVITRRRLEVR